MPKGSNSGVYVAIPCIGAQQGQKLDHKTPGVVVGQYIPFVVRGIDKIDRARSREGAGTAAVADVLFKTSDLTWTAYNKYGGWNLYEGPQGVERGKGKGNKGGNMFDQRATAVSYDRPWHNRLSFPLGQSQNFLFSTEYPLLFWLEKHAFDVTYASCADVEDAFPLPDMALIPQNGNSNSNSNSNSNINSNRNRNSDQEEEEDDIGLHTKRGSDTDTDTDTGDANANVAYQNALTAVAPHYRRFRVILSVGHDEYWTSHLRQVYTVARDCGVSAYS